MIIPVFRCYDVMMQVFIIICLIVTINFVIIFSSLIYHLIGLYKSYLFIYFDISLIKKLEFKQTK